MVIGHDPHVGIMTRSHLAEDLLKAGGANIAGGEIKQVLNPGTSQEEALKFVTDYLQANPKSLDGVWVGWDHAALGAVQAINEAGRKDIFVTGVDAVGIALAEIKKNGPFHATVVQDWPKVLDLVMNDMTAYAADGSKPAKNYIETDVKLVDGANVNDIKPTD
jgi:ribose transport system substrate-binding protein